MHPWITRNENDKIPLTPQEELERNFLRMDSERSNILNNSEFLSKNKEPIQNHTKAAIKIERLSERDSSSSNEYSLSDHQNESSGSIGKIGSRNASIVKGTPIPVKSKISNLSKLSKRSTLKLKKNKRNNNFINRSAKKRVLTVNKALSTKFNSHRRNKDKFLLPPIRNGTRCTDTYESKSNTSRAGTDNTKRKLDSKKINSIPLGNARIMGHKSPIKVPISKRLSDHLDLEKKQYCKNYDFSIKKPCRICLFQHCQCTIPKSSKYQPGMSKSKYKPPFKSVEKRDAQRSSLTRIELNKDIDQFSSPYNKEKEENTYFPKSWIFSAKIFNQ